MAEQAGNEQGGNVVEMSYVIQREIKDIIARNGLMNKKSSIEMLHFYSKRMKPQDAKRAQWTIQCLKYNLAWDVRPNENSLFR